MLLKYFFCIPAARAWLGTGDTNVNKTTGKLPSGNLRSILSPNSLRGSAGPRVTGQLSLAPGAGGLPPPAGVPARNLIFKLPIQLAKGSPRKLQMFPRKNEKLLTRRSLSVAKP